MEYKKITIKELKNITGLTDKRVREIKSMKGGFYNMNAQTSDCYAFNVIEGNDFEGGYDWKMYMIDKNAEYIFDFDDHKFYEIKASL